jgi:thiamine-phosphate pyrophosphorylase
VIPPDLIVITDDALSDDEIESRARRVLAAVPAGSTALQLRDRRRTARTLLALAERLRSVCARHGAPLLVNDRIDIALAVGADGAHLGGRSVGVADARRLLAPSAFLSVAAHDVADVEAAASGGATAALVSPIYATPGKGTPRGPQFLSEARPHAANVLLYALGGIDAERAVECVSKGAYGVAAIRGAWADSGGASAACAMVAAVRSNRR